MMEDWRRIVQSLYPDLQKQTYCVPPVYFNRVPYIKQDVAGQSVLVTQPPLTSKLGLSREAKRHRNAAQSGTPSLSGKSASPSKSSPSKDCSDESTAASEPPDADFSSTASRDPSRVSVNSQGDAAEVIHMWTRQYLSDKTAPDHVDYSDTRDDFAQQHVLHCLRKLGVEERQEAMFIVSQLNFSHYLSKASFDVAAAGAALLPRPVDLSRDYRRGDFDVLLIHPHLGILIAEVKSVGSNLADVLSKTEEQRDSDVTKRVKRAIKQLDKSEVVMKHMVSDITPDLVVKKTLILPYVTSAQLQRVLQADTNLEKAACRSLGATDAATATKLCVCSDQMSDRNTPWDVTPSVLKRLDEWFRMRMDTPDPSLTPDVYHDIVARIAGPATTVTVHCVVPPRVEVRTLGEAVSECGERLVRIVLTPAQLDLLNRAPDVVYLTGPPGTGKTLVLILIGLVWLRQGHDVHVASTRGANLAASQLIYHQLQMTLKADASSALGDLGTVYLHQFDLFTGVERPVETLVSASESNGDGLHVLIDEADIIGRES